MLEFKFFFFYNTSDKAASKPFYKVLILVAKPLVKLYEVSYTSSQPISNPFISLLIPAD